MVKSSDRKYMMFETSYFHEDLHAMREIYGAGGFGKLVYSEGEYYHDSVEQIDSYKGWRIGLPPQWYPGELKMWYCWASTIFHFSGLSRESLASDVGDDVRPVFDMRVAEASFLRAKGSSVYLAQRAQRAGAVVPY